ncbi:MAG: bifunctional heptose 7-phosphate kinase/heptose 1-phosphate adenyltransferase [Planctomycetes bacterium]|nr:bifunctional heptose 7-phosphate kinase/heptose 1-phosphate adenyltransferase [Planctomycetota bacterium]
MSSLLSNLASYKPFTAIVVGDFMLDQNIYGAAERLSPDAPVPILHASRFEDRPGGAANVALCLIALKANVKCFGVVGDDREGQILKEQLTSEKCDIKGLLEDTSRPTTVKRNMIGLAQHRHPQKMFRLDMESTEPISDELTKELLARIETQIDSVDVVCLEDYDKGVCTESLCQGIIKLCRAKNIPVLVDPASIVDYTKYHNATAITPNRSEAEKATGVGTPLEASKIHNAGLAKKLINDLDLDAVVVTLDKHGALLEERGQEPILVPTTERSVYDVTGAGDMVLASLAAAIANNLTWFDAVTFANAAAGLAVEVFGVQPIPFAQVQREILNQSKKLIGKVRSMDELLIELAVHRQAGHKIVLTNGCFDVIHIGHLQYLKEAGQCGDVLVVGVNSDQQISKLKGEGRPVFTEPERLEILSEFESIDYLTVFDEPTAHDLIRQIKPDIYVKGGDYKPQEIVEFELLEKQKITVRVLAHRPGMGSTEVIERFVSAARPAES